MREPRRGRLVADPGMLLAGVSAVALVTLVDARWLRISNQTTVALTLLLVVLVMATASSRRVAVATSLMAFACFNFFFLPPLGTFSIADPENWVALFTLLAVSLVASHLSSQVRSRAREALTLLEQRKEAELVRRNAELKSMLLASLSHDLRTPLTAVTVAANNLEAAWLTDEQRREQADIVRAELERLNRLFQNIVDMARIDTKAVAPEREWVEPAEIVDAALRQAEAAVGAHRVDIDAGDERVLVKVDPRLSSAALAHVLENAGQYSPTGSRIEVHVSTGAGKVEFAVRDHGTGIAPDDLSHVFERFYRGVHARERRQGSGMGLAITHGLVAAQNGHLSAANHPAGGAVFTMTIPAEVKPAAILEGEIV